jgi:hypothetical protein
MILSTVHDFVSFDSFCSIIFGSDFDCDFDFVVTNR